MNLNIFQFLKQGTSLSRKSMQSNSKLEKEIIFEKKEVNQDFEQFGKFDQNDSDLEEPLKTNNKKKLEAERLRLEQKRKQFLSNKHIKVSGLDCPEPLSNFTKIINKYKLKPHLIKGLENLGYRKPTAVQCQVIPCLLEKRNIIVTAPTGTGKTLSYLLPVLNNLSPSKKITCIIMAPIQQLVTQIMEQLSTLTQEDESISFRSISQISEEELQKINKNKSPGFNILVTTPLFFLNTFQQHRKILSHVEHIVLDECDKYFQESFFEQIKLFLEMFQEFSKPIYSLFSATIQHPIEELLKNQILHDCLRVEVGGKNKVLDKVKQTMEYCTNEYGKIVHFKNMIIEGGFVPPALIFVQEKARAKQLYFEMKKILKATVGGKTKIEILTGDKSKQERKEIIDNLDRGVYWALITTDLIARGIDFRNVNLVINYDFPNSMLTYIHRVGRTGRADRSGEALTLFTDEDKPLVRSLGNLLKASGCSVPEWIMTIPKSHKKVLKKLQKYPTKRLAVGHSTKKDSNWEKHLDKLQVEWNKLKQSEQKKMRAEQAQDNDEGWQVVQGSADQMEVEENNSWQVVGHEEDNEENP